MSTSLVFVSGIFSVFIICFILYLIRKENVNIKYSLVNLENSFDNVERKMLLLFIDKKDVSKDIKLIRKFDPQAVITSTTTNIIEKKEL